jgi:hypothetical protein
MHLTSPALPTAVFSLSGDAADRILPAAIGLTLAVLGFFLLRRSPRVAVGLWICVVCFVPIWFGLGVGFNGNYYLPPQTAAALLVIATLIPIHGFRLSLVDALVALLIAVGFISLLAGSAGIALSTLFSIVTFFIVGYVFGRVAPLAVDLRWLYGAVGVAFTIVAVLALGEFALNFNPFVQLHVGNSMYSIWGSLQTRGGAVRAEGAFGHSIALGASLALAIPLTLGSRFRFWLRGCMVLVMLGATVVTFSRIGMITALLGLVLSIVFLRGAIPARGRVAMISTLIALSAILFPVVATVFDDAGTEASNSATYRSDLLSLLSSMNVLGVASSARKDPTGAVYFGNFHSIDSQLILTGLSSGLVALGAIVAFLAVAAVLVLRGKATAATIAVVAQIPAFATVALITQYAIFAWFVIGVAATSQLMVRREPAAVLDEPSARPARRHAETARMPHTTEATT